VFEAPADLPDDPATLQAILRAALAEIERLEFQLAGLRRNRFGRRSEKLADETVRQATEDLEQSVAEKMAGLEVAANANTRPPAGKSPKRNRGTLPVHLPRVEVVVDIEDKACACCGGSLHQIGEDQAEMLDYVPAQFRVRLIRRPRYGCRACENAVVQAPAPDRPIDGGMATEALVAQVRRPPSVVSPVTDLCPSGHRTGSFHIMQLGGPCLLVAGPAARTDAEHRFVVAQGVC
jgi:transposase